MSTNWPGQEVGGSTNAPAAAPSGPTLTRVLSVPDTQTDIENARAERSLDNSTTQTGIAVRGEARDITKDAIQNAGQLQQRYESLAPVKEYRTVLPQLMQALEVAPDPSGDNSLLYAYAKIMDPGSVVRESEQENAASGASVFDTAVGKLKKQLGWTEGGLPPEIRENLKRDALQRVQAMGRIYRQQRDRFAQDAQAYGIDPARVIGPDDFSPYVGQFEQYMQRQRAGQNPASVGAQAGGASGGGGGGLINPEMRGGVPLGSQIQWNADQPETPFDRNRYLQENYGITSDQEAQQVAFWNQNRGNPNLTIDAARQWYQSQGFRPPSDQNLAQSVEQARQGIPFATIDTTAAENEYRNRLRGDLQQQGFDPTSGGAYAQRAARGLELGLSDEIQGLGAAAQAASNLDNPFDAYRYERDKQREAFSQMEQQQGIPGYAAELAGGLVGPAVEVAGARALGASPRAALTATELAKQGARQGAIAGYGYGEGLQGSTTGAVTGAVGGAALGYGLGRGADALAARRAAQAATPSGVDSAQAYAQGQRFGIDLSPGDVGGMGSKAIERILDVQPGAATTMNTARKAVGEQLDKAVGEVAGSFGPDTTFRGMGQAAQSGAQKWMDRFNATAAKAYDAIPIASKAEASVENTRRTLADLTDVFESNPELRKLLQNPRMTAYLRALTPEDFAETGAQKWEAARRQGMAAIEEATAARDAAQKNYSVVRNSVSSPGKMVDARQAYEAAEQNLSSTTKDWQARISQAFQESQRPPEGGKLSWEDLKHFRSIIGEQMGEALLSDGSPKSQLKALYGALSRDMEGTAAAQSPQALTKFRRANDLFAQGQNRIEGAITSLIGNDSKNAPEAAASFLQRISNGGKGSSDLAALAEVRKTLRPEEWGQVSNSFIRLLGQPANNAGREFNPGTFIRAYNDMAPEAKNLLFGGQNKVLRQNLDDFAQVVGRIAENNSTRNTSNTAMGLAGLAGYGAGGVPGLLGQALLSFGSAKAWTNPAFVRWATGYNKMLAGAARGGFNEAANSRQLEALSRIAANDNVIAQDVLGLQQALAGVLNNTSRAAAAPAPQTSRKEQGPMQ